ncbi:MAG: hypothetical protein RR280_08540 [Bacteroidaceae bacterium]
MPLDKFDCCNKYMCGCDTPQPTVVIEGAVYKHRSGKMYELLSESNKSVITTGWLPHCVTYKDLSSLEVYTRPRSEFIESFTLVSPPHSIACLYNYHLAFLHLEDTPELRKLYWASVGHTIFVDDIIQVPIVDDSKCPACTHLKALES